MKTYDYLLTMTNLLNADIAINDAISAVDTVSPCPEELRKKMTEAGQLSIDLLQENAKAGLSANNLIQHYIAMSILGDTDLEIGLTFTAKRTLANIQKALEKIEFGYVNVNDFDMDITPITRAINGNVLEAYYLNDKPAKAFDYMLPYYQKTRGDIRNQCDKYEKTQKLSDKVNAQHVIQQYANDLLSTFFEEIEKVFGF